MCFFITSWVSENIDKAELERFLKEKGFGFKEYPHSPIKEKVGAAIYFRASTSWCDCNTQIGSSKRTIGKNGDTDKQAERLRKKGWKESRIKRWLDEQEHTRSKSMREEKEKEERGDTSPSNEKWLSLLKEAMGAKLCKSFGLLYHPYHGDQTKEDFEIKTKVVLGLEDLGPEDLSGLDSETPYEFRAAAKPH